MEQSLALQLSLNRDDLVTVCASINIHDENPREISRPVVGEQVSKETSNVHRLGIILKTKCESSEA